MPEPFVFAGRMRMNDLRAQAPVVVRETQQIPKPQAEAPVSELFSLSKDSLMTRAQNKFTNWRQARKAAKAERQPRVESAGRRRLVAGLAGTLVVGVVAGGLAFGPKADVSEAAPVANRTVATLVGQEMSGPSTIGGEVQVAGQHTVAQATGEQYGQMAQFLDWAAQHPNLSAEQMDAHFQNLSNPSA